MNLREVMDWIVAAAPGCPAAQSSRNAGSVLVAAALEVERVCLPAIACAAFGQTLLEHKIKRLRRFIDNCRIQASDAMQWVIRKLFKQRKKRCCGPSSGPNSASSARRPWRR